jgi:transposase-like protein
MQVRLHANAATTPRTRAYIQQSAAPVAELAAELGVSETTIRRWRGRSAVEDRSHRPKRLSTRLTPAEEEIVLELKRNHHQPRCRDRRRLPQTLPGSLRPSRPHHPHR